MKASSVLLATGLGSGKLSARNQFNGTVKRHEKGAVNDEVVIAAGDLEGSRRS